MARRSKAGVRKDGRPEFAVRGAHLDPIRVVEREITLPDGSTQIVEVPVYPPFRLEERPAAASARARKPAKAKPRRPKTSNDV